MKATHEEVKRAVLLFGEKLGQGKSTPTLLETVGVYSTVKTLAVIAFTNGYQQYFEQDDKVFDAVTLVREYSKEMSEKGEVRFGVKYGEQ